MKAGINSFNKISLLVILLLTISLAGCQPKKEWQLHDISGHLPDLAFSLVADDGQGVTAAHYQGKTVLLYFGFTGCGAQCPVVMKRLADVLQRLGPAAASVQVLFVTIDPSLDTPAGLHRYLAAFDGAHMVGLTGNPADILALAKRCRIATDIGGPAQDDTTHSNAVFIFDQYGHARLLLTPEDKDDVLIHDLKILTQ